MIRITLFLLFILPACVLAQNNYPVKDNPIPAMKTVETDKGRDFFFTRDDKCTRLVVPSDNNGLKLYGIKIFNSDGEELISQKIDSTKNPNTIDISKLPNGGYIVHAITVQQDIYRTKFSIARK